ncbi:hypothetical protein Scep_001527 [Stephania cephalantha]|uniref:Uncharacterized protein n=1 Tax=Stephania cephalantha TaxID=152367 RepID=A0AAP0L8K3_9MAGN
MAKRFGKQLMQRRLYMRLSASTALVKWKRRLYKLKRDDVPLQYLMKCLSPKSACLLLELRRVAVSQAKYSSLCVWQRHPKNTQISFLGTPPTLKKELSLTIEASTFNFTNPDDQLIFLIKSSIIERKNPPASENHNNRGMEERVASSVVPHIFFLFVKRQAVMLSVIPQ